MKQCPYCNHTRAAHADGIRCALCPCRSRRSEAVQESFTFREAVTAQGDRPGRKR